MRPASSWSSARTTRRSTSTSTWRASAARRTRSTTCSMRTRASRRSCARPARSGSTAPGQADLRAGRAQLEPAERALVKRLLELPEEVRVTAERRAPHRLTTYAHDVASDFHAFYRDCRVVGAEPAELEDLRLVLVRRDAPCDRAGARPARSLGAGEHVGVAARAWTCSSTACGRRAGEPAGALVLLHGRGVDESDLFPLLDELDPERRPGRRDAARAAHAAARRPPLVHRRARRVPAPRDVHGELRDADRMAGGASPRRPASRGSGP